jgi:hypothetical protein
MIPEPQIAEFNRTHPMPVIEYPRPFKPGWHLPPVTLWQRLHAWWQKPPSPRVIYVARERLSDEAMAGALAVADTEAWWRAVHQAIDDLEQETIRSARDSTLQPELCVSHVAAGEGLDMLRKKLNNLRERGLKLPEV